MNITWLLESTAISGRNRAVLALADALVSRGHRVRLVTEGPDLTWRHSSAEWIHVDDVARYDSPGDYTIATSLSTIKNADAFYFFGDEDPAGVEISVLAASQIFSSAMRTRSRTSPSSARSSTTTSTGALRRASISRCECCSADPRRKKGAESKTDTARPRMRVGFIRNSN